MEIIVGDKDSAEFQDDITINENNRRNNKEKYLFAIPKKKLY
jgi:hypothetical protein